MKKIIMYSLLVLTNIVLGLFALFFFYIGYQGFWTLPTYNGGLFGFILMLSYLFAIIVQSYFVFYRTKNKREKKKFFVTAIIFLLIFSLANISPLKTLYNKDETVHKDPVFKKFAKDFEDNNIQFNRSKSDDKSYSRGSYYFYFDIETRLDLEKDIIENIKTKIPNNLNKDFFIVIGTEEELYLTFSKEKEMQGCFINDYKYGNTRCFDLLSYSNIHDEIAKIYNNTSLHNGDRYYSKGDSQYRFLINKSNESMNNPEIHEETMYNLNGEEIITRSEVVKIYFEKTKGEINLVDLEDIMYIVSKPKNDDIVYIIHLIEPSTKEKVLFSIHLGQGERDVSNAIYFIECKKDFCKDTNSYFPNALH